MPCGAALPPSFLRFLLFLARVDNFCRFCRQHPCWCSVCCAAAARQRAHSACMLPKNEVRSTRVLLAACAQAPLRMLALKCRAGTSGAATAASPDWRSTRPSNSTARRLAQASWTSRTTARTSDDRRRPERRRCRPPVPIALRARRSRRAASAAARKQAQRPTRMRRPQAAHRSRDSHRAAAAGRLHQQAPDHKPSGTARHHRSERRPSRGSPSTSRTSLRHRRAPQKGPARNTTATRSRVSVASILWPPMNQTCTTRPSARR